MPQKQDSPFAPCAAVSEELRFVALLLAVMITPVAVLFTLWIRMLRW